MQSPAEWKHDNKVILVYKAEHDEEKDLAGTILTQGDHFIKIQTSTNTFLIPRNRIIHIKIKQKKLEKGDDW